MNETLSLIAVTTLLAIGGLGLFMFKSSEEDEEKEVRNTNGSMKLKDEDWLGSINIWGNNNQEEEEDEISEQKVKPKNSSLKTKRNRKSFGTKRRY